MEHNYEYPVHPILFLRDNKYLTRAPSHPSLLKHVSDKKGLFQNVSHRRNSVFYIQPFLS